MSRRKLWGEVRVLGLATLLLVGAPFVCSPAIMAEEPSACELKIRKALNDSTSLEFIETPLRDVVDFLKDLHGIEIQIDTKAMDGIGVSSDTPVTRNLKNVSLRSALTLVLRDLDLTFVIRDDVLQITTPAAIANDVRVQTHPAADIITDETASAALTTAVEMALDPPADMPPRARPTPAAPRVVLVRGVLVVRGTILEHERVAELLAQLRRELKVPSPMPGDAPGDARAKKQTRRPAVPARDPFGPTRETDPFADPPDPGPPAKPAAPRDPFGN